MSVIRVYVTGERVTDDSAEHGDAAERGWKNSLESHTYYDSRNDVAPILEFWGWTTSPVTASQFSEDRFTTPNAESHAECVDAVRNLLGPVEHFKHHWESDNGSTLYSMNADIDYVTGDYHSSAIHATIKYYKGDIGWVEDEFNLIEFTGYGE
jgi:hypothetical protein